MATDLLYIQSMINGSDRGDRGRNAGGTEGKSFIGQVNLIDKCNRIVLPLIYDSYTPIHNHWCITQTMAIDSQTNSQQELTKKTPPSNFKSSIFCGARA